MKKDWSRRSPPKNRTSSSVKRRRPAIRSSTKPSNGSPRKRLPRLRPSEFLSFAILSVRVTPVFSRCRRVAQRLERLLDTQEVGGSSPPVPTKEQPSANSDQLSARVRG